MNSMFKVLIDDDIRGAVRPLTEDERSGLRIKLMKEGCREPLLFYRDTERGMKLYQLDGHTRREICGEERIPFNWHDLSDHVRTKEEAIAWVKEHHASRRNLSREEIADLRLQRIENVVAARQRGQSTRAIAEAEGVSQAQIRRDLEASGETGVSPEPEEGKVTGQDGKEYPASKPPILCKRCRRNGPVKDCAACLEARAKQTRTTRAAPTSPARARPTKNGEESYNPRLVGECFGKVVAQLDRLAKDHGCCSARGVVRETPAYLAIRRKITEVQKDIADWRKQLSKGK